NVLDLKRAVCRSGRAAGQKPDADWDLLGARRQWPRCRCASNETNELPPPHARPQHSGWQFSCPNSTLGRRFEARLDEFVGSAMSQVGSKATCLACRRMSTLPLKGSSHL